MNRTTANLLLAACVCLGCTQASVPDTTQANRPQTIRPADNVSLTVTEYAFMPSEIHASRGQTLHLTVKNHGMEEHGLVFDLPTGAVALPSHFRTNESEQYTLHVPNQPGTYYFHCPVGNHYSRGMEGSLIVQ